METRSRKMSGRKALLLKTLTLGCASAKKDKFAEKYIRANTTNAPTVRELFSDNKIPAKVQELIAYICSECMVQTGNFRIPGSNTAKLAVCESLTKDLPINYTFGSHALASGLQTFTRQSADGIMSREVEEELVNFGDIPDNDLPRKYQEAHRIMQRIELPAVRQYLCCFFGMLYRYSQHQEWHQATANALARAASGAIFTHSYTQPQATIMRTHVVSEWLIENFPVVDIWGYQNLQYFCDLTKTGLVVKEITTYKFTLQDLLDQINNLDLSSISKSKEMILLEAISRYIRRLNKKHRQTLQHTKSVTSDSDEPGRLELEGRDLKYRSTDTMPQAFRRLNPAFYPHGSADQLLDMRRSIASRRESVRLRQALVHKKRQQFMGEKCDRGSTMSLSTINEVEKETIVRDYFQRMKSNDDDDQDPQAISRMYITETVFLPKKANLTPYDMAL